MENSEPTLDDLLLLANLMELGMITFKSTMEKG